MRVSAGEGIMYFVRGGCGNIFVFYSVVNFLCMFCDVALLPQASYLCGNFLDSSCLNSPRAK